MSQPTNDDEEDALVQLACHAALRNDTAGLCKALGIPGSNASSNLRRPLLTTHNAQILQNRLLAKFSSATTSNDDALFRALLMVPPLYESPFAAALSFVNYVQSKDCERSRSSLRSSVTEIQSFLQQTVAAWWERERRFCSRPAESETPFNSNNNTSTTTTNNTARCWILKIVKQIVRPFISDDNYTTNEETNDKNKRNKDNDYWMLPLELITTILSILHGLDRALDQDILDAVFQLPQNNVRPDRLLPWLSLATDLHTFLRPIDWKVLLESLNQKHDNQFDKQDLPGLMTSVLSLATTTLVGCDSTGDGGKETRSGKRERSVALKRIALGLFHAASVDPGTFSTVTAVFQGAVTGHSGGATFGDWLDVIEEKEDCEESDNHVPRWVKANMVLALLGGTGKSSSAMLDNLLSRALMHTKRQSIVAIDGWRALLRLASFEYKANTTKNSKGASPWIDEVERIFKGSSYMGDGCFQQEGHSEQTGVLLNQMGRLVYQSLFLVPDGGEVDESFKRKQAVHIVQRAQDWIHAANNRIRSEEGGMGVQEVAMVVVAFVVVFCELPLSQSFVVRGLAQALAGESYCPHSKTDIALLNCHIISTIVKHQPDRRPEVWKPIVDIIAAGKLSKRVFFAIVQTIARTSENAQAAILSISRKYIQSPIHSVSWGLQSLDESCDRVQCSLFSFCVLTNLPSWNENAAEAWKILSDVIVTNRPPLPVVARTWLFDLLEDVLESWETSPGVTDRLFRACLMRILSFVERNKALNKMCLCPRSLFTVWGCSDALSVRAKATEDLPGLLKLASNLFFLGGRKEGKIKACQTFSHLRSAMLHCCCPAASTSTASPALIQFGDKGDVDDDAHRLLYCKLLLTLMTSAADFALRGVTNDSTDASCNQEELFDFDVDCPRSQLVSLEIKSTFAEQDRPQWVSERVANSNQIIGAKTPALPHYTLESLACSLCDSVAMFVVDHRWSFLTSSDISPYLSSPREGLVLSLHGIYKAKRALSRNGCKNFISPDPKHVHNAVSDHGKLLLDSAVYIDFIVASNGKLSDTMNVLGMVVDHVDSLKKFLDEDIMHRQYFELDLSPILFGLWQLYSMVCSQGSSIRLIAYLENMKPESDLTDSDLFESPTQSPTEIDEQIRHLRHTVLNAYLQSLQVILKHGSATKLFTLSPILEKCESSQTTVGYKSFRWSENASTKPEIFLVECLRKLANDLVVGLQGQSGGVSTDMYTAFIESLDVISKLLISLMKEKQMEESTFRSLSSICCDGATDLRDMFCSFPPQKKSLFCKALLVIAEALPMLARCTSREIILITDGAETETEADCPPKAGLECENFAVASFKQCVGVLESWIGDRGAFSWATLEVPDVPVIDSSLQRDKESHKDGASTDAGDSIRSPEPLSRTNGVPTVVTIMLQRTPDNTQGSTKNASLLPLNSKEMWSWTCSSALVALECVWIESFELLRLEEGQQLQLPVTSSMSSHVYQRASEFSGNINSLSLAFNEHVNNQPSKHGSDKTSTPRYLIEAFPVGSKLMLCSLASRMVTATDAALRVLDYFIRLPESVPRLHGFVEALSIALVWLSSDEQSNSFDYVACIRKWCTGERGGLGEEEEKIRKLFSKLVFRIERLESSLHKLNDLFLDTKALANKEATMKRIDAIDKLIELLIARGMKGPKGKSLFRTMVERKAKGLVKRELESRNKRAADPRFSDAGASKRKRPTARQDHRRRPIRSRNQTVDKWLRNDQQLANDGHEQDAFMDLEDFIADG